MNSPRYDDDPPRLHRLAEDVLERVSRHPDVEAAAITSRLPLRGGSWGKLVSFSDRPLPTSMEEVPAVRYLVVSHGYFEALGARLLEGRPFDDRDQAGTQPVAIVNETFARRFWGDANALGKIVWMGPPEELIGVGTDSGFHFPRLTIVGIVADERFEEIDRASEPEVYQLHAQSTETPSTLFLAVRARGDPAIIVPHMRRSVREADPLMPLAQVATMSELVRTSSGRRRVAAVLVSAFAVLSLALALVGIYGVSAQFAAHRRRELAIRLAVGAASRDVMTLVLREGGGSALAGAAVGIAAAMAGSRYLRGVLYGVSPTDPATYSAITAILLAVVLVAVGIPARRATRIPPAAVLRGD